MDAFAQEFSEPECAVELVQSRSTLIPADPVKRRKEPKILSRADAMKETAFISTRETDSRARRQTVGGLSCDGDDACVRDEQRRQQAKQCGLSGTILADHS